jgi:hypothetical protein
MGMTYERAVKVMIAAVRTELVRYAFDASLFEKGLCSTPNAENSFKKRERIKEAIRVLQERCKNDEHSEKETSSEEKDTS